MTFQQFPDNYRSEYHSYEGRLPDLSYHGAHDISSMYPRNDAYGDTALKFNVGDPLPRTCEQLDFWKLRWSDVSSFVKHFT